MATKEEIVNRLIQHDVLVCQSSLISALLAKEGELDGFSWDEVQNLYRSPGLVPNQFRYVINLDERGEFWAHVEDLDGREVFRIASVEMLNDIIEMGYMEHSEDAEGVGYYLRKVLNLIPADSTILEGDQEPTQEEEECREIYEWWAVSKWLYEELDDIDAPVLSNDYGWWWGRTETGQSLTMDADLNKIAADLLSR